MKQGIDFTTGKIVAPLLKFAGPVLLALFLQAMYGAVDLLVVGKFSSSADVSAVSTGSQIMMTITNLISSLCMGMTVLLGHRLGEKKTEECGRIVGSGLLLFFSLGILLSILIPSFSVKLAEIMHAPEEAFDLTAWYLRICGAASVIIIVYNLIGGIFRGIGDSNTPLVTVLIACIANIAGDLLLVAFFHMGTRGAAIATVAAQLISVLISCARISKMTLPFPLRFRNVRWDGGIIRNILSLGTPIALQDLLVSISFLVIMAIVNSIGLTESAGVGVAEKVCAFIMLVPSAFMQSMSAFVAQNRGAGQTDRAFQGFRSAVAISFVFGVVMFYTAFFHGDLLSGIFAKDAPVIAASADYLKAYGIDCLLTCFLFCFVGFYNGMGKTNFVMVQGILGAFAVRVPVSYLMSRWNPVSLFHIGLATPCSTILQITLCCSYLISLLRKQNTQKRCIT
ncbi:MATE family efflux transporter [Eubacterium pyruvativorans]|uniref:MATE family efflux transporter n=2 Tax=Eubacterium pyruvativorans TaxID=155865 RepID=UPI0015696C07|nr:MATE family efflux transporter [Eubacterium pyruvativorans]